MPGFFGALGISGHVVEQLRSVFEVPWSHSECVLWETGGLGGHAFKPGSAVHDGGNGLLIAIDGEASLYSTAQAHISGTRSLFTQVNGHIEPTQDCKGNIAVLCRHTCVLFCEWSGTFPLYYVVLPAGLAFCSRQRPLAKVLDLPPDPIGCIEYLKYGYTLRDRTQFRGLRRLLPGQLLEYDSGSKKLTVSENSSLWAEDDIQKTSRRELVDNCWTALTDAARSTLIPERVHAVLLSGGWDSRTLLAAALDHARSETLLAYSHGDLRSAEIGISRSLARTVGVRFRAEPVDKRSFDPDFLRACFARTEDVRFPWWHVAGRVLAEDGAQCASSGIYGEVLGGHYGIGMLLRGSSKAIAVAKAILRFRDGARRPLTAAASLLAEFHLRSLVRPFYLSKDFWACLDNPADAVKADLDWTIARLINRGIGSADKLLEAFISEQRGTQYINGQILSCRSSLDIASAFVDRNLLRLACRIPLQEKVHNILNRDILRRYAPGMLVFPCAATLVPASYPIVAHEAARVLRRVLESARRRLLLLSGDRLAGPRFGWDNFEFLRHTQLLRALQESNSQPVWDRRGIDRKLVEVETGAYHGRVEALSMILLANHSLDLMLR